jgi:hypothetical protein
MVILRDLTLTINQYIDVSTNSTPQKHREISPPPKSSALNRYLPQSTKLSKLTEQASIFRLAWLTSSPFQLGLIELIKLSKPSQAEQSSLLVDNYVEEGHVV